MNVSLTDDRRWRGLALGLLLAVAAHLAGVTNTSPNLEPWPILLSAESPPVDPGIALLQQRASGALERLVHGGTTPEPL